MQCLEGEGDGMRQKNGEGEAYILCHHHGANHACSQMALLIWRNPVLRHVVDVSGNGDGCRITLDGGGIS